MFKVFGQITNELKQVKWPTRKQLGQLTIYVIVFCAIISVIILGLDLAFKEVVQQFMSL